ncbi:MAG: peptide-methionine (S)-S-oxide reductase MsrA [Candidatus Thorarchaeota archaeon]
METITLGGGCFWCIEAVFQEIRGVTKVVSGYAGGDLANPTYEEVSTGTTGHAEVCQIEFDPGVVTLAEVLEVFFASHDPTTPNRQGGDVGPQYRSIILYSTEDQRTTAERVKADVDASHAWNNPVITEIVPLREFFPAEDYHQNYYQNNSDTRYCRYVIRPKLDKVERVFSLRLKE